MTQEIDDYDDVSYQVIDDCDDASYHGKLAEELFYAVRSSNVNEVKRLIACGADVNAFESYMTLGGDGFSILFECCNSRHLNFEITRILIEAGADLKNSGSFESSVMESLAERDTCIEMMKLLIDEYNADINWKYHSGKTTVLHSALCSRYRNNKMIKFILDHKADPNARTRRNGQTPLHIAVKNGRFDAVKLLLEYGADVYVKNEYGHTPLHYASHYHKVDIVELLKRFQFTQTENDELTEEYIDSFYSSI